MTHVTGAVKADTMSALTGIKTVGAGVGVTGLTAAATERGWRCWDRRREYGGSILNKDRGKSIEEKEIPRGVTGDIIELMFW